MSIPVQNFNKNRHTATTILFDTQDNYDDAQIPTLIT